jgi:hypothetical protein
MLVVRQTENQCRLTFHPAHMCECVRNLCQSVQKRKRKMEEPRPNVTAGTRIRYTLVTPIPNLLLSTIEIL